MQCNVKHGDYLRTLGGAMTAQCKVLHLLFSQSDYPKIVECHIIQSVCIIGVSSQTGDYEVLVCVFCSFSVYVAIKTVSSTL